MNLFKNLKVKTKLISSFLVVALLIAIVGLIGKMALKRVAIESEDMYRNNMQVVYMLTDMTQNLTQVESDMLEILYVRDSSKKADLEKDIQENKDEDEKYIESYEKLPQDAAEKQVHLVFKSQLEQYRNLRETVIKSIDDNNYDEAEKQYVKIPKLTEEMFKSIDKLVSINLDDAKNASADIQSLSRNSDIFMSILTLIGFVIAILLGYLMAKDINRPLMKIKSMAEGFALYDFSVPFIITRGDEFGQTGGALITA